jgi:hypothetical protein
MCRNIRTLFNFEPPVTEAEIHAASLQFVRKISGFNAPSKANEAAFFAAVDEVARISSRLLSSLQSTVAPKNRQEEAAKARARRSKIRRIISDVDTQRKIETSIVPRRSRRARSKKG